MDKLTFRPLRADEVDVRVATCKQNGVSLLLYKDARCDMNILDETVGPMNWQRRHGRENANCVVSIWDENKKEWVGKEDTGTESNTEAEKGLASDSFKRACFNWGIGRELYTAPFIWIGSESCDIKTGQNGKAACYDRFRVTEMTVEAGKITSIAIANESRKGAIVYRYGQKGAARGPETPEGSRTVNNTRTATKTPAPAQDAPAQPSGGLDQPQIVVLRTAMMSIGQTEAKMLAHYGKVKIEDLTSEEYADALAIIDKYKDKRRKK